MRGVSYWLRTRRGWAWFQIRVRSGVSRHHPPIQRSAVAFIRGAWILQRTVRIPASARTAPNALVKSEPRSRIMNLTRPAWSPMPVIRLRACWVAHSPVGCKGDPEDADAPGGVLDGGQGVGLGAVEQVGREEIACQDRVSLGAREL